jgi:hypothetical protein
LAHCCYSTLVARKRQKVASTSPLCGSASPIKMAQVFESSSESCIWHRFAHRLSTRSAKQSFKQESSSGHPYLTTVQSVPQLQVHDAKVPARRYTCPDATCIANAAFHLILQLLSSTTYADAPPPLYCPRRRSRSTLHHHLCQCTTARLIASRAQSAREPTVPTEH